jgi:hypothetical protein
MQGAPEEVRSPGVLLVGVPGEAPLPSLLRSDDRKGWVSMPDEMIGI